MSDREGSEHQMTSVCLAEIEDSSRQFKLSSQLWRRKGLWLVQELWLVQGHRVESRHHRGLSKLGADSTSINW